MTLFLASLGVLFLAGMVAYLVIRLRSPAWPPAGAPPLPRSLWLSTALIVAVSAALQTALRAVRARRTTSFRAWTRAGLGLGGLFLVAQAAAWAQLVAAGATAGTSLFAYTFFVLTAVHALHVLGGLAALGWVVRGARRGRYTNFDHAAVEHTVRYWHFLGGVWLALFALLALV